MRRVDARAACASTAKEVAVELIATSDGAQLVLVHDRARCAGSPCPIHSPSDHPLRWDSLRWRSDRGIMERICKHGIGHPDPDDLRVRGGVDVGVHGCDGCCRPLDTVGEM